MPRCCKHLRAGSLCSCGRPCALQVRCACKPIIKWLLPVLQLFISVLLMQCYTLQAQNLENDCCVYFRLFKKQKNPKIRASSPIISRQIDGEKAEMVATFFLSLNI